MNIDAIKKLYKFEFDVYYAKLSGLFITTEVELKNAIGKMVLFGEVAGKHSEVYKVLDWTDFHELVVSDNTINDLLEAKGNDNNLTICGCNPLDYIREAEEEKE